MLQLAFLIGHIVKLMLIHILFISAIYSFPAHMCPLLMDIYVSNFPLLYIFL